MRERIAQILKIVCLGLVALLVYQLVQAGFHGNPLAGVKIPEVPSLPADTNAPPTVAKGPTRPGTNSPASAMGSNGPATALGTNAVAMGTNGIGAGTNAVAHRRPRPAGSNDAAVAMAAESISTNKTAAIESPTNVAGAASAETNIVVRHKVNETTTNSAPVALASESLATNNPMTNFSALVATNTNISITMPLNTDTFVTVIADTNVAMPKVASGTNVAVTEPGKTNGTNAARARAAGAGRPATTSPQTMGAMGGPGGATKAAKLPPEIQARVDRVVESEIFAPINHPMPMALLGVAGKVAFLRAPSGQTGMVKEGDSLGEIKLLRVGINRVLVEQDGQPKELMIFSGLGGESLLPKPTVISDETTKH
jgi:hypothetical protein